MCAIRSMYVLVLLVILTNYEAAVIKEKTPFQLDDYLNSTFPIRGFNGSWLPGIDAFVFKDINGDILKLDLENKNTEVFFEADILAKYVEPFITVSGDLNYVLIKHNTSKIFRHSTSALYSVYDRTNKAFYDIASGQHLQFAQFGTTGHSLFYILENNIYYVEDFPDSDKTKSVTTIGSPGKIYCGITDWVYEEEVLSGKNAIWMSPDGSRIAYAVFNDQNVSTYSYFVYGTNIYGVEQYPTEESLKYPKAGTSNPLVNLYVYDITTETTLEFQLPTSIDNKLTNDYIFYDLTWISNTEVSMISTNRVQNRWVTLRCNITGSCFEESIYEEEHGWIRPKIPIYNKDGTKKAEILPQPVDDDRFYHLVITDVQTTKQTRLTYGKSDVTNIHGWDVDSGLLYFTASVNNTPYQQHLYVASTEGEIQCLSCNMEVDGRKCTYVEGLFSKTLNYFVKVCGGPVPPLIEIENAKNAKDVLLWEDNSVLRDKLSTKLFPKIRNLEVPVNSKFTARVRLLLPPNLDETSNKKYPAIVNPYAGPGSNQISDILSIKFEHYLVTNREYIYIFIDGRGSGRDGLNKMFQVYRRFGTVEIEDQINVTRYLQQTFPFIDGDRIGIWGWSYGGFTSTWALAKDTSRVFNFALAVAPVTNFLLYDSVYTERYMGLPTVDDNEIGYNNTDVTREVESFRNRNYFIIHGNADDNVHYQNAMLLIRALELTDISFRQMSYPNENHSLRGTLRHVYHTIDKYFAKCFDVKQHLVSNRIKES